MVTLDNASNNATMMSELESELAHHNIPFHHEGNRVRLVISIIILLQTNHSIKGASPMS